MVSRWVPLGVALGMTLAGCRHDSPVEVRTSGGSQQIFVAGELVHETADEVSQVEFQRLGAYSTLTWTQAGAENFYALQVGERQWTSPKLASSILRLRSGAKDTTYAQPKASSSGLAIVQFSTQVIRPYISKIESLGATMRQVIPDQAILVELTPEIGREIASLPYVKWIGPLSNQDKILSVEGGQRQYVIVPLTQAHQDIVLHSARAIDPAALVEGRFVIATLGPKDVFDLAELDQVSWIEPDGDIEYDMDNALKQGGAKFIQTLASLPQDSFLGENIRGHVMEGIYADHWDFAANDYRDAPIAIDDGEGASHGHSTYGIVFGDGSGSPEARGFMPRAQGYYTNYREARAADPGSHERGSRYELVGRLMNEHRILFQTASWGFPRTTEYTARSLEMDEMIFDFDIPVTQSQSNSGTRMSRPQAWAKNVISVGAVYHYDNDDPADDTWEKPGAFSAASIGPATDGRIKPDLCAYYDDTWTVYGSSGGYGNFGGTSGATPIVAGHLGLSLEMWGKGVFGNHVPEDAPDYFAYRPHFTTSKALLINTASQYAFDGAEHDLTRVHQGWGFPNLKTLWELRDKLLIVNEEEVLSNLEEVSYDVSVAAGEPIFNVTLVYADPPGSLNADKQLVNDLNLKVISPTGEVYHGNYNLDVANYSVPGGEPNSVDTVENVFVKNPTPGQWQIIVGASNVQVDAHRETPEIDADFALVASGITRR